MKATLATVEPSNISDSNGNPRFTRKAPLDITRLDVEICESLGITRLSFYVTNGKTFNLTLFGQPVGDVLKESVKQETEDATPELKTVQP